MLHRGILRFAASRLQRAHFRDERGRDSRYETMTAMKLRPRASSK